MAEDNKVLNIGILIGNFSTKHPMEVLRGLCEVAEGKNVKLTLISGAQGGIYDYWDTDGESNISAKFSAYDYQYNALNDYALLAGFDVIIVAYGTISMYLNEKEKESFFAKFNNIPIIIIQDYDEYGKYNYVIADNYDGMFQMVKHLIKVHNCQKLVYLSGPHMNTDASERLHGYMDAMRLNEREVTSEMIEYGDYSQTVDNLVEKLLDNNPDADAIVCANDEMCRSAYRVCKERGLIIGKDIAITGFDDVDIASDFTPPLTTVRQDGYTIGCMAMELAMQGVKNGENRLQVMPVHTIIRSSCGCDESTVGQVSELDMLIRRFKNESSPEFLRLLATRVREESLKRAHTYAEERIIEGFMREHLGILIRIRSLEEDDADYMALRIEMVSRLASQFRLSSTKNLKFKVFLKYVDMLFEVENRGDTNYKRTSFRNYSMNMIHRHMESLLVQEKDGQDDLLVRRYWDAPILIRMLQQQVKDWNTFFGVAVRQVMEHGGRNVCIYLNDGPYKRFRNEAFVCPTRMYLTAASDENDKIVVYEEKQGPVIDTSRGFAQNYFDGSGNMYGAFLLFSENDQYGILVCELPADAVAGMHGVSIQISSGLSALHAARREEAVRKELYETLRVLREKNKILNSVSSNDPMTGIFNRRGFTEKALEIIRLNEGLNAILFFADLDHLKEINDVYGHNEGDFAINTLADSIQDLAGVKGCCARIGGDEFIALVPCDEKAAREKIENFKNSLKLVNKSAGKPYYIESSIGYTSFTCEEDIILDDIISEADKHMYEAKKKRRATIRRDV